MDFTVIHSPAMSALENMEEDRRLLDSERGFILRFFTWSGRGVTLGSNEDPERSLNLEYVKEHRIEIARRPTGGRAVYHHDNESEITFSVTCPRQNPFFDDSIRGAFQWVSSLVIEALEKEGVPLINHQADQAHHRKSNACFDSALKYEISVNGCKVFGSAQKRTQDRLLIQSTLLLKSSNEASRVLKTTIGMKGVCDFYPEVTRKKLVANIEAAFTGLAPKFVFPA